MNNKTIRIERIILNLNEDESCLEEKAAGILWISKKEIINFSLVKKAIDARKKTNIVFVYSVDIEIVDAKNIFSWAKKLSSRKYTIKIVEPYVYTIWTSQKTPKNRPIIIGTWPAWLFAGLVLAKAGLKPLLIERWQDIDNRNKDVDMFVTKWELKENSNIQFGEGGAWTFSDGKLYTLVNDPRSKFIFEELIKAWAPEDIIYNAKPHIGTDKLKTVVKNLRKKIIALGWEVKFNSCLNDIEIDNNTINAIEINNSEKIQTDELILAIGHSARDTYKMLYEKKLEFQQKPFAMWLRIEHDATTINKSQFGEFYDDPKLPTANYRLVNHSKTNRSVFSFCMCPGWYIVPASSEEWRLTINGMSKYKQDGQISNSALLVSILPSDFGSDHPLAGIEFQRKREEKAFISGGENYNAPVQLVWDFLENKTTTKINQDSSTYKPGITPTSLDSCLPKYVIDAIKEALPKFDRKINWFANPNTLLIWIEARSSSVVRIVRDKTLQSNIHGIYPTGEWAGYAWGITSAAIDGLKVAEKIIEKYM